MFNLRRNYKVLNNKVLTLLGFATKAGKLSFGMEAVKTSIKTIGNNAFHGCVSLAEINYLGTVAEWNKITLNNDWDFNTDEYVIHCKDGDITKDGTVTYK